MDTVPPSGEPINAAAEVLGDPRAVLVPRETHVQQPPVLPGLVAGSEEVIAAQHPL